ncbi:glycoside hydrolase family protein [Paenibacillus cymbidii]|uniref:hypothetical protein n=1 Tax=Paenibacillus cymbidii TaxID=1639034 RepID=UPI0010819008|nr:hypothetical protein [Paenibacillus cymbidii]
MIHLANEQFDFYCGDNGSGLALIDRQRGTRWTLDPRTQVYGLADDAEGKETPLLPLVPVAAWPRGEEGVTIAYRAGEHELRYEYRLSERAVDIRLPEDVPSAIGVIALPGAFVPAGEPLRLALPIMQGMLWDGRGKPQQLRLAEAGHGGFSMPLIGYIGQNGGLLLTAETCDDTLWWIGKEADGRFWAANLQRSSLGSMRYAREVRLTCTDAGHVAIAKAYRRKVIEQGRFRSWEDKIAARPMLERLFGALMCFVGYCQDDELDYAAECAKLRDCGFDRALVYPARFNMFHHDIHMGGLPPIRMSGETVAAIERLGYDVAPWSWVNEALDTGTDEVRARYRRKADGSIIKMWKIDDQQWYVNCNSTLPSWQEEAVRGDIADMTWDHFDVITCASLGECYALDHAGHRGYPLSRSEDREWLKRLLLAGQAGARAVSSETFNDAYSLEYDIGSVKALPLYGHWPFWPIPLTMLVYHDSMIHSWWEVHNYNNPWHGRNPADQLYERSGGRAKIMAAMDALTGCPPDVFPFGAMYAWTGNGSETALYRFRLDDPEVRQALDLALPVAKLHRRIGKLELVDHRFVSEDGNVQETTFADGTRIVANFSIALRHTPDGLTVPAESWIVANEPS